MHACRWRKPKKLWKTLDGVATRIAWPSPYILMSTRMRPTHNSRGNNAELRCPETLFISHEKANFLFSVFRVVQGEEKTIKIMGCCRANFAFLHALKIGTFRGK